jgi:hypothetical protein
MFFVEEKIGQKITQLIFCQNFLPNIFCERNILGNLSNFEKDAQRKKNAQL